MPDLNGDQFAKISKGLTDLDNAHPTSAYEANKGGTFFHGTTADIKGSILPAHAVGKNASDYSMGDPGDMSEGDHAFVTKDEGYAWHAAGLFHRNGNRPRVYSTGPAKDMEPGPWHKDHPDFLHHIEADGEHPEVVADMTATHHQPEYGSKTGFPVRKRIDIMPGRQGTFPEVNWNKHKDPERNTGLYEANHPDDLQVREGMAWSENVGNAIRENRLIDKARGKAEPARRAGASLRAFMNGEPPPKPDPHAGQGKLF